VPRLLAAAVLISATLLTSCGILTGRCGIESRGLILSGRIPETDANLGYIQVDFVEQRADPPSSLAYLFISAELKGHIRSAALLGPSAADSVELPVADGSVNEALHGQIAPYGGPISFERMRQLGGSHQLWLRLTTDISSRSTLLQSLGLAQASDWARPYCD